MTHHGVSEIIKKYKAYCANIFESWEDYIFASFYLPELHQKIKKNEVPILDFENIYTGKIVPFKKSLLYGVISRQERKIIGQKALLESVSATENFLQKVTYRVYRDFDRKLLTQNETSDQQFKILKVIVDSDDKSEIINRLAEEKIRGIFYGNPLDFFEKDKAKIGLNDYFKKNYPAALKEYKEIIARRNIYAHNNGKVDRKYNREVSDSTFRIGEKVIIDKEYIRNSIFLLHGFSSVVVEQVLKNTYAASTLKEGLKEYIRIFNKKYKGK